MQVVHFSHRWQYKLAAGSCAGQQLDGLNSEISGLYSEHQTPKNVAGMRAAHSKGLTLFGFPESHWDRPESSGVAARDIEPCERGGGGGELVTLGAPDAPVQNASGRVFFW